jgi:hypothetical protein
VGSRVEFKESDLKQGWKLRNNDWKEVINISILIGIQHGNYQVGMGKI